ncbi:MAG: hypothetical protein IT353_10205 [Gemmatimonadaceae bacterium]|nr:hypothetical protein [Gemmatimonadaceae bacterium]
MPTVTLKHVEVSGTNKRDGPMLRMLVIGIFVDLVRRMIKPADREVVRLE